MRTTQPRPDHALSTEESGADADVINPTLAPVAAQLSIALIAAGLLIFILAAISQGIHR